MTFNSMDEIKNYILSQSGIAIENARNKIYLIIDGFLRRFYSEYDPSVYERTWQLFNSFVMTDIQRTANGWKAEIYFDITAMNHSFKSVWSEEEILKTAMVGDHPHGGWPTDNETQIWTESMKVLNAEAMNILKQELIGAGIPIR